MGTSAMVRLALAVAALVASATALPDALQRRLDAVDVMPSMMVGQASIPTAGPNGVVDAAGPVPKADNATAQDDAPSGDPPPDMTPDADGVNATEIIAQSDGPENADQGKVSADGKSEKPAKSDKPATYMYEFNPGIKGNHQYLLEKPGYHANVFPYKVAGYHPLGMTAPEGTATKDLNGVVLRRDHPYHTADTNFGRTVDDVFKADEGGMDFEVDNDGMTPKTFSMDKASLMTMPGFKTLTPQTQAQKAADGTLRISPYATMGMGGIQAMGPNGVTAAMPNYDPFMAAGKFNMHNTVNSYMGAQVAANDAHPLGVGQAGIVPGSAGGINVAAINGERQPFTPELTNVPDPDKFTCVKINNGTFMCHKKTHGNQALESSRVLGVTPPTPEAGNPQQVFVANSDGTTMTHKVFNPDVQKHVHEETYTNHVWKPNPVDVKVPVADYKRVDVPVEVPVAKPVPTPVPVATPVATPVAMPVPTPAPVATPVPVPVGNPFMPLSAMGPVPLFLETTAEEKKEDAFPSMLGMGSMYGYGSPMFAPGYPSMSPYGVPSAKDTQKMLDAQAAYIKKAASLPMGGYMGAGMYGTGPMGYGQFDTYSPFGNAPAGMYGGAYGLHRRHLTPPMGMMGGFNAAMPPMAAITPMAGGMVHGGMFGAPSPSMYHGIYHAVPPMGTAPGMMGTAAHFGSHMMPAGMTGYGYNAMTAAMYDPLNALSNMKNVFGPLSWEGGDAKKADAKK